ncbi:M61 family metallopeptidase [Thermocoleostomius sinensis]|jgi:predicted metalloprotease with PDZ domain|uniref:M61 family metallopeptidase n=1 Tax=Thermocoleostomius sinensis A174 TaxID=2016057 RepID=A0A9E8ZCB3_9CYAN|nr:M61 family metallopeptidase [Thermocoleostomius sinensis]WAL60231.1 M61 family metallopeptidase [Thermocoleostomius sinensis A174]
MTEATQVRPQSLSRTALDIHYYVSMPQPSSHLFEVTLQIKGWHADVLDLKMPVWTPGSYLVREYARHLQEFQAEGERSLSWQKLSKNHWQIATPATSDITVRYRIYANELTVRTNHLDSTHAYFNGAALFFYIPGFEHHPLHVTIVLPKPEWRIATPLPSVASEPNTFEAIDFDTLVDSPFEVGLHFHCEFEVLGKPHEFVIWGMGNAEPEQIVADTQKIIEVEAALFGGLPYDRYLFLLHLATQGFGGLEHKNSCSLIYSRFGFRNEERYYRFMQLVAHEFFHLWNVKRIRPKALEVFNYEGENYTPSLWFSEGTTSYYDLVLPMRAGIYDARTFLKNLSKEISRYLTIPGRHIQALSESSFDAWIKLYRRDANSDNSQISYYLKGEMVSLLLDLQIRSKFHNQRSLDDVMRQMWQQFGQLEIGFTPEQLQTVIESVAEESLSDFFQRYLHTTEDLPFDSYLTLFGLRLQPEDNHHLPPFLGLTAKSENGREIIKFVEVGSPAQQAGLDSEDELLAINGLRVKAAELSDRLRDFYPGELIYISVFHQDELCTYPVTLGEPRPASYQLVAVESPTSEQQQALEGWLGVAWDKMWLS